MIQNTAIRDAALIIVRAINERQDWLRARDYSPLQLTMELTGVIDLLCDWCTPDEPETTE